MSERPTSAAVGWRRRLQEGWRARSGPAAWARRIGIVLITIELLYLVGGNLFLHTDAGRSVINQKPEKVRVELDGAWTLLPGVVRVRGLEIEGSSRRVRWSTRIDRGWTWIWLPSLASQHVRIVAGRQVGVEVDVDLLARSDEPPVRKPGRGWRVTLGGLRADELRRFRVDDYEIEADALVRGWVRFEVRGPMELRVGRVALADGVVRSAGEEVADRLAFDASFTVGPWRVHDQTVGELLAGTTGSVELEAEVENLGFLDAYLGRLPWLGLSGSGELSLTAALDDGLVQAGSEMALEGEILADFYDFQAKGSGRIDGGVETLERGVELTARVETFELERTSDGVPLLVGEGFETSVTVASTAVGRPPEDAAGTLKLASARAEDLSRFAPYLRGGLDLEIDGGFAEVSVDLEYDTASHSGEGMIDVELAEVGGSFADARFSMFGSLDLVLASIDLAAGRFDIDGTRIELERGTISTRGKTRSENWSGSLDIPTGEVVRPLPVRGGGPTEAPPVAIEAAVEIEMSDSAPVVALMEHRLPKLRFANRILTVQAVELKGQVSMRERVLGLHSIEVEAGEKDQLEILLDLELEGSDTRGAAYARYRALAAAVDLERGERDWSFRRPKRKYEEAVAARRAARAPAPPS